VPLRRYFTMQESTNAGRWIPRLPNIAKTYYRIKFGFPADQERFRCVAEHHIKKAPV
jgi:hypothetical protein